MPIVEPEVTLGPGDYSIEETAYWSQRVYSHVFRLLNEYNVMLVAACPLQLSTRRAQSAACASGLSPVSLKRV